MSPPAGGARQRTLLARSLMTLVGDWNRWLPARLARTVLVAPLPAAASIEETR